jgi:hypothetical protein
MKKSITITLLLLFCVFTLSVSQSLTINEIIIKTPPPPVDNTPVLNIDSTINDFIVRVPSN